MFFLGYIIFDENYINENTLKTHFIHIFCIKYYIIIAHTQKYLRSKLKKKDFKKSKVDNNFGMEVV